MPEHETHMMGRREIKKIHPRGLKDMRKRMKRVRKVMSTDSGHMLIRGKK